MKRGLDLNLARRPFTNDVLLWLGVGLLVAVGLGLSAWNVSSFLSTGSQVRELEAQRQALDAERRQASRREEDLIRTIEAARSELLALRASFANTIIQSHSFSWTRLFNELEKVMPLGVRLMNVRPRVDDGIRIRLDGVARDAASFWELQENLQGWPVFGNVYPDAVQPSTTRAGVTGGELLISLEMEYFPDARALLGLPDHQEALVQAEPAVALEATEPGSEGELAGAAPGEDGEAGTEASAAEAAAPASDSDPVLRRGRRGARPSAVAGGVQRLSKEKQGAPGLEEPEIGPGRLRQIQGGAPVFSLSEDGRLVDEDGNPVDVEDIINTPGGIRPGPPPDADALKPPLPGDEPPAETDEPAAPAGDGAGGRRGGRGKRP